MENGRFEILIIDDNVDHFDMTKRLLSRENGKYTVDYAQNGSSGLELISSKSYDLVLLDYSLPGMSGIDVLQKIQAQNKDVPVIMVTGMGSEEIATQALKLGASDYIIKSQNYIETLPHVIRENIEKNRLRKEKEKLQRELVLSKEEAEFVADLLYHDIRNYMTPIMGYLELLNSEGNGNLSSSQLEILKKVSKQANNILRLIDNVKKVLKLAHKKLEITYEKVNLINIFNDVITNVTMTYPNKVMNISNDIAPDKYFVKADGLIIDMFQNLIENAIKYCQRSPVQISIDVFEHLENEKPFWKVTITDNGPGVPENIRESIFNRFERGNKSVSGTGLGLSLVKLLATKYGGRVWVESKAKDDYTQGSVFCVCLPQCMEP